MHNDHHKAGYEQTLAEQLGITERDVNHRKAMVGLTDADAALLKAYKPMIQKYLDGIMRNFYDVQTADQEVALLIGDAETMRNLQNAMRRYIIELFDGYYDMNYVNRRLRVGKVHKRIGVTPKLYLAAVHQLKKELYKVVDMHSVGPDKPFSELSQLKNAISTLLMFDVTLIIDTYTDALVQEAEVAREQMELHAEQLEQVVAERTYQLEEMSRRDMLTGLYNQRAFHEHIRRELASAERYREVLSLAYFDLNDFKELNDTQGHEAGDAVLELLGRTVMKSVRETDIPCRNGGDEFCIIFPRTPADQAEAVCQRLVEMFKEEPGRGDVSFSLGIVSTGPDKFLDAESLIRAADQIMYRAKAQSKTPTSSDFTVLIERDSNIVTPFKGIK